ncbi:thermonuclease family protein [Paracoccus sp. SM22M-07]|uniref:thermonuclease family protein n=1 Tax=Paracoccus sp. SM22M-07 TaxID=1520813 RepID=UPI000A4EA871|nr:thermonuclease family protein [Paracoccus sp. SM22M-07]
MQATVERLVDQVACETHGRFVPHQRHYLVKLAAAGTNVRSGDAARQRPAVAVWRLRAASANYVLWTLAFSSTPQAMGSRQKTRRRSDLQKLLGALAIVAAIMAIGDRNPQLSDALKDQLRDILQSEQVRDQVAGLAHVIDGDTLHIGGTRIRMFGIDAPEGRQTCARDRSNWDCGKASTDALVDTINQREVRCEERDTDRYGRVVAECWTGKRNLNAWMVAQGWAVAYRQYGGDIYDAEEQSAKNEKRGVWSSRFDMPWDWRRRAKGTH